MYEDSRALGFEPMPQSHVYTIQFINYSVLIRNVPSRDTLVMQ